MKILSIYLSHANQVFAAIAAILVTFAMIVKSAVPPAIVNKTLYILNVT